MTDLPRVAAAELVSLYRLHGRALQAFVVAWVRDAATAEDICQETFMAVFSQGMPQGAAARWLFAIARNKARQFLRDRKSPAALNGGVPAREAGPQGAAGNEEDKRRVRAALDELDVEQREVLALRYEGGLDCSSIADRLEVPLTTVEGRLRRARESLLQRLVPRTPLGTAREANTWR
ncbi:RNA polymerase sigma factor [bacterium]|nr:RNA polymerase sigma factor [bacterium]